MIKEQMSELQFVSQIFVPIFSSKFHVELLEIPRNFFWREARELQS